jgi:hypothetical protein
MPAVSSINERVTTTPGSTDTGLYACWRLVRTLVSAGWTVVQSSDGTSFGAADYWTTFGGLGTSAWIVLQGPGSRQICLWRDTTSMWNGKFIYSMSGGHAFTGASASTPGALPATAQYVRGSGSTFNSWFGGGTKAIRFLTVMAKDVTDGSFWILGSTPLTASGTFYHHMAFLALATFNAADTDPYVFYNPAAGPLNDTSTTNSAHTGGSCVYGGAENGALSGYWWGWARNTSWRSFVPRFELPAQTFPDANPYTHGTPCVLSALGIGKGEASWREFKGYVRYVRLFTHNISLGDTIGDATGPFRYVYIGSNSNTPYPQAGFWWDGSAPSLALDI